MATKATPKQVRRMVKQLATLAGTYAGDAEERGQWTEASNWRLVQGLLDGIVHWPALPVQLRLLDPDS